MSIVENRPLIASLVLSLMAAGSLQAADSPAALAGIALHVTLDLRSPDITEIYSPAQIEELLSTTFDEDIEEVRVESARPETIPATERMQVWRWAMPLAPNQAKDDPTSLDTVAFLPPIAVPDRDPAMFP
jgi:hypothetical protein